MIKVKSAADCLFKQLRKPVSKHKKSKLEDDPFWRQLSEAQDIDVEFVGTHFIEIIDELTLAVESGDVRKHRTQFLTLLNLLKQFHTYIFDQIKTLESDLHLKTC